ncbi:MAG TPA: 50S ribosomal protein L11 methyltransferase, partial [Longimicrobiales bacterium]|nr:50S ribosomal protein L11 methyltransferase [Longimicrobiales bacterium]
MPFQSLTFTLPGDRVEALTDALLAAGALSVDVADAHEGTAREEATFGEPGSRARPWIRSRMTALFQAAMDAGEALASACRAGAIEVPDDVEHAHVDDQDWVRLTQNQ